MFRRLNTPTAIVLALAIVMVIHINLSPQSVVAEKTEKCGELKWKGTAHNDNKPSMAKFWQMAKEGNFCALGKCIDLMQCEGNVSVDPQKFMHTLAYLNANSDQQKCIQHWSKDGNGQDELAGYEVLYCTTDNDST